MLNWHGFSLYCGAVAWITSLTTTFDALIMLQHSQKQSLLPVDPIPGGRMTRPASKVSGFTLIELLIVVVILSTLAAIVVPQFASSGESAKVAAAKSTLSGIRSAISIYNTDHGSYPLKPTSYCTGVTEGTTTAEWLLDTMRYYSNSAGKVCNIKTDGSTATIIYPYGPYLRANEFPMNPLVNNNGVQLSTGSALGLTTTDVGGAWLYQAATGEIIIRDTTDNRHKF